MSLKKLLPGFKATCIIVGTLDIFLASSMFVKGVAEFKVPENLLASPHKADAYPGCFFIVYNWRTYYPDWYSGREPGETSVGGKGTRVNAWFYLYLDIQLSDNYFGNALLPRIQFGYPDFY